MTENSLTATLEKFGLTQQEANVFILLSQIEKSGSKWATAPELSKLSGKDRVRTYQILRRLQHVGLVESRFSRPKKYAAITAPTAIRRLMAIQETRLTELSYLEKEVVDSLLNVEPIVVNRDTLGGLEEIKQSGIVLVQGIPNIHATLRKIMANENILMITNDESYDHLSKVIKYLTQKPKSLEILHSSSRRRIPSQKSFPSETLHFQAFPRELPTVILAGRFCILPFYSQELHRRKALSKPEPRVRISDLVLTDDARYVQQMKQLIKTVKQNTPSSQL